MPQPSRLVLLEQLHSITPGTKVRFLGCVHVYDGQRAQVTLKCNYPATGLAVPTAIVDIEYILESLGHELLEIGAWLNVVGYVEGSTGHTKAAMAEDTSPKVPLSVLITATMIWSAGAFNLDRYHAAVSKFQETLPPV